MCEEDIRDSMVLICLRLCSMKALSVSNFNELQVDLYAISCVLIVRGDIFGDVPDTIMKGFKLVSELITVSYKLVKGMLRVIAMILHRFAALPPPFLHHVKCKIRRQTLSNHRWAQPIERTTRPVP